MRKGQTSVDLLLAVLAAIVFLSVLGMHNESISAQLDDAAIKGGLRVVLLDAYAAAGQVKANGVTIEYTAPQVINAKSQTPASRWNMKPTQVILKSIRTSRLRG